MSARTIKLCQVDVMIEFVSNCGSYFSISRQNISDQFLCFENYKYSIVIAP